MAHAPAQFFGSRPPGALRRGQKFNFLNMYMWHIKLTGLSSIPGYTEIFLPTIKLVTFNYHKISSRAWGFAMARHRMCSSYTCIGLNIILLKYSNFIQIDIHCQRLQDLTVRLNFI